jgi:hypothetical protein
VSAAVSNPWHATVWHVISYREAVYQACPGCCRVRVGERVRLTGTVKSHGEYNGQPQTTVTRCKVEVV